MQVEPPSRTALVLLALTMATTAPMITITNLYLNSTASIDRALDGALAKLDQIIKEITNMNVALQEKIDSLTATVAKLETAESSVLAFVKGVPDLIAAAVADAAAQGATPEQLQSLTDLTTKIATDADALTAAIVTPGTGTGTGAGDPTAPGAPA